MTFNTIIINFDSKEEQEFVESNCSFSIHDHDIDELWAEFNIAGCEPNDLLEFESLMNEYCLDKEM